MSRLIPVDALLATIEEAKTKFALEATSQMPEGPHAAHYHYGVIRGMESVRQMIINKLKEPENGAKAKVGESGKEFGGGPYAY